MGVGVCGGIVGLALLLIACHVFGHIGHGDTFLLHAQLLKDETCRLEDFLALVGIVLHLREIDCILTLQQVVHVFQHFGEPLRGGHHFVDADAAVLVGIHQRQRLFVELQTLHGATQHGPEFLIQLVEVGDILASLDVDARHASDGAELPVVAVPSGNKFFNLCHNYLVF